MKLAQFDHPCQKVSQTFNFFYSIIDSLIHESEDRGDPRHTFQIQVARLYIPNGIFIFAEPLHFSARKGRNRRSGLDV